MFSYDFFAKKNYNERESHMLNKKSIKTILNSNFKLDVQGNIDKIAIDSTSKVDINVSGKQIFVTQAA